MNSLSGKNPELDVCTARQTFAMVAWEGFHRGL